MKYNPSIPVGLAGEYDHMFAVVLRPDADDIADEEKLLTSPTVWRKCNPHIGTITQLSFYEQEARNARANEDSRKEFLVKLLNIFQSNKTRDWVKPHKIRSLQIDTRIYDLDGGDGWVAFAGIDLSGIGDDLYAMSYLAVNTSNGTFFADCHAWITEEAYSTSPVKTLFSDWSKRGWIDIVCGATFNSALFLEQVERINERMDILAFGYDPYKAKMAVNDLSAWVANKGVDPKDVIFQVRQGYAIYNPLVMELDYLINSKPQIFHFSSSPLWAWEFGNCVLDESSDGYGNVKPVKSSANAKVDNVQCLLTALHLFDKFDGRQQTE